MTLHASLPSSLFVSSQPKEASASCFSNSSLNSQLLPKKIQYWFSSLVLADSFEESERIWLRHEDIRRHQCLVKHRAKVTPVLLGAQR